ncbi:hypothetical protein [uncultured Mediterranean phage uvMED]|nr:hypothetical protein [uncultured Mediterranean phage uvMED]|tara:strand:+ start:177 stop:1034 length:858 start_codon:yes stop_codon:yes gene_type:complete
MNPRSMLKRIQSKQRLGEYRGKVEFRQKLKTEAKSLDNAQQRLNEIIAESDEQLLKKKKRMNLLGNVGRAIGAGVAAVTGAGLLAGAAYYAIGGKLGSEVGQNIASKKSRRLEEEEQEEILANTPLIYNKSKKAVLSSAMNEINNNFIRKDNQLDAMQWSQSFEDFLTYVKAGAIANAGVRTSFLDFTKGDGTLAEVFKAGTTEGGYIDPTKQVFQGFGNLIDKLGKNKAVSANLNAPPVKSRFEHMMKINAPQVVTKGSRAKGFTQYSVPKSIFDVSKPVGKGY